MIKARIDAYREERRAGEDRALPFLRSRRSKFRIWPPSFGSSIPPAIDYAFRGADPARIREDASGFKNSVIGPQIRSQPGQGPNTGRLNARSVDYLPSCQRHDHSRFRFSLNRFVAMRTVKEQAAAARVSASPRIYLRSAVSERACNTSRRRQRNVHSHATIYGPARVLPDLPSAQLILLLSEHGGKFSCLAALRRPQYVSWRLPFWMPKPV